MKNAASKNIERLARGAVVNLLGKFFGRALHFISQIVIARTLGPSAFGLFALGWNIFRVVGNISALGLDNGVIHYGMKVRHKNTGEFMGIVFGSIGLATSFGVFVGCMFFLFSNPLAEAFRKPELGQIIRLFSIGFPFLAGVRVAASATRITKIMKYANLIEEFIQPITNLSFVLIVFIRGWEIVGVVIAAVISFAISFFVAMRSVIAIFPFDGKLRLLSSTMRQLLTYSFPTSLSTIFGVLLLMVDRIVVGYYLSKDQVGIFQTVSMISVLFVSFLSAFKMIVSPMIAENFHLGNLRKLDSLYQTSTRWTLIIGMPALLLIFFAPGTVLTVLFGAAYEGGELALLILAGGHLINVATGAVDHMLIMSGFQKNWLWIMVGMFIYNVIMNWILVPIMGINGAALASATTFLGSSLAGLIIVRIKLGLWPYNFEYVKSGLAATMTAGGLLLLGSMEWSFVFIKFIAMSLFSAIFFYAVIYGLGLSKADLILLTMGKRIINEIWDNFKITDG